MGDKTEGKEIGATQVKGVLPMPDGNIGILVATDENYDLLILLKPGAVGPLVAGLHDAASRLDRKEKGDRFLQPLKLTGAQAYSALDGQPALLLEFENAIEMSVLVSTETAMHLAAESLTAVEPPRGPQTRQ